MTISIKDYRFGHARVGVVHIIGPPPFDEAKAFKVYIASYLKIDLEINQSRLLDHYYSKLNFCIGLPSWNDDALVDIISCVGGVELINLLTFESPPIFTHSQFIALGITQRIQKQHLKKFFWRKIDIFTWKSIGYFAKSK